MSRVIPWIKLKTLVSLGPLNLAMLASYRTGVKLGVNPVTRLRGKVQAGPYFHLPQCRSDMPRPSGIWKNEGRLFGWYPVPVGEEAIDWFTNAMSGVRFQNREGSWWKIPDFASEKEDIKVLWEPSRFDWVIAFSQAALAGNENEIDRLNAWLDDWYLNNPGYTGPNWKCGQEASIRVLHLAMAAILLGQHKAPAPALVSLVRMHLERIAPTLHYAMAQDNNHGTSEAAALFVGGTWLSAISRSDLKAKKWAGMGRGWLENRVSRLIEADGSFSQYSVNYHRVMLDTLGMAEVWRRAFGLDPFSRRYQARVQAAALWLKAFTQPINGDAPNIGANDGARLLPLAASDYRDHRPSVQLACVLFLGARAYPEEGEWNAPLRWLGLELPVTVLPEEENRLFDDGGYAVLRAPGATAYLRYPRFRFRPGHADALHLDLWVGGENLLRDAGTFSYNTKARWIKYFPGTAAHNTVEFDGRDQMPRLSRFLFGDWLKVIDPPSLERIGKKVVARAGYRDGWGAEHERRVKLAANVIEVEDWLSGFREKAVLRWRLCPGDWRREGDVVTDGSRRIFVSSDTDITRLELVEGWESRYYQQKSSLPVLEAEVAQKGTISTRITW